MKIVSWILLSLFGWSANAFALSPTFHLGVESSFSRNVVTPASFPFYRVGVSSSDENHQADLELRMNFSHAKASAITSKNFFYEWKNDSALSLAIGRKWMNWSEADESFQLGAFGVLDSWDRLRSSQQGLTGIFIGAETEILHFDLFVSHIMLPEITPNVVIENNRFESYHPQAVSAGPQTFDLLNRPTPLGYNLLLPSISKIIFRPSVAFSVNSKTTLDPISAKFSYGYLPLNYFPIALEASLAIPLDQIVVDLRPRLLSHHLYAGDLSYRVAENTKAGFALLVDQIVPETSLPTDYTTASLGTTTYLSPWIRWEYFKLSHIYSNGGVGADSGPYANPNSNIFSSRVLYRNATQLQFDYRIARHGIVAKYLHEFSIQADWIALDWTYRWNNGLSGLIGVDVIGAKKDFAADRGAEFLSDLRALDRIRLGVTYVF